MKQILRPVLAMQKSGLIRIGLSHMKKADFKVGDKVKIHRKSNTQFEVVLDEDGKKKVGNNGVNISPSMTMPDYLPGDEFEVTYGASKLLLTWLAY